MSQYENSTIASGAAITIFCALVGQWTMFYIMVIMLTLCASAYFYIVRNSKDTKSRHEVE